MFKKLVANSFMFRLFLFSKLPMAYIAGVRVKSLTDEKSTVTIKYKWLTQNPFKSMYFACQAMAAEMSTGLLVMNYTYKSEPAFSMLIIKNEAEYYKKAVGKITFTCEDGNKIKELINQLQKSNEGVSVELISNGFDEKGDKVSQFKFVWSLKAKT